MYKTDLPNIDNLYYVGDLVSINRTAWVDEETAELILLEYNNGVLD